MPKHQSVLRVFLASPGDLGRERYIVRDVVKELNTTLARRIGFHVELIGWEDTLPGFGRPQAVINRDLDQCEFFIGLVWERWGSPTGKYSSGFEEEYEIAISSREKDGTPDIVIYFKEIDSAREKDPGEQLQKVLAFRKALISEKKVLFGSFTTEGDLEKKIRASLTDKLLVLWEQDRLTQQAFAGRDDLSDENRSGTGEVDSSEESALSREQLEFLKEFQALGSEESDEQLDRLRVARLRLLSSSVKTDGNDDAPIGPHDANLIFRSRHNLSLSNREIVSMIDAGLENYSHEVVPLWHWLRKGERMVSQMLPLSTIVGASDRRVAAIDIMRSMRRPLPKSGWIKKSKCLENWFKDGQASEVKVAAIRYLGALGGAVDTEILTREIDRGDHRTASAAKEAVLTLSISGSRVKALNLLIKRQFVSVTDRLLDELFENHKGFSDRLLKQCLDHRDAGVRVRATKILRQRHALTAAEAERLKKDEDTEVRLEALLALVGSRNAVPLTDARRVLVRKSRGPSLLFGASSTGEEQLKTYREKFYLSLGEARLLAMVEEEPVYDQDAFFALCRKNFTKHRKDLVSSLRVCFTDRFDAAVNRLRDRPGGEQLSSGAKPLRDHVTKEVSKEGLNILCEFEDVEALPLARKLIPKLELPLTPQLAMFFRKHGEWDDIELIASAASRPDFDRRTVLGYSEGNISGAVEAISAKARNRLSDFLHLSLDSNLAARVISKSSIETIRQLSDEALLEFLNDERDQVRRAAALKVVKLLPKKRIARLLDNYVNSDEYRYYNTIFWLDLGVSYDRTSAVELASNAILEYA